ncbi:phage tail assembly chaperone G [Clostridium perfringens]|uniref:phage tail assembly chaperone G n=1 Tax=Clostridium perfringens TaxID=1502 RepID=UPI0032DBE05A
MQVVVKGKKYESGKITRNKYKVYSQARDKIAEKEMYDDSDLDAMVKVIVAIYGDKFTEDDVNDDMEVSDIILSFSAIDFEIAKKVNSKVEKIQKDFMKGKK